MASTCFRQIDSTCGETEDIFVDELYLSGVLSLCTYTLNKYLSPNNIHREINERAISEYVIQYIATFIGHRYYNVVADYDKDSTLEDLNVRGKLLAYMYPIPSTGMDTRVTWFCTLGQGERCTRPMWKTKMIKSTGKLSSSLFFPEQDPNSQDKMLTTNGTVHIAHSEDQKNVVMSVTGKACDLSGYNIHAEMKILPSTQIYCNNSSSISFNESDS